MPSGHWYLRQQRFYARQPRLPSYYSLGTFGTHQSFRRIFLENRARRSRQRQRQRELHAAGRTPAQLREAYRERSRMIQRHLDEYEADMAAYVPNVIGDPRYILDHNQNPIDNPNYVEPPPVMSAGGGPRILSTQERFLRDGVTQRPTGNPVIDSVIGARPIPGSNLDPEYEELLAQIPRPP